MSDTRLLLTPERTAELLDVSRTTVYALLAAGELESVQIGRSRRIPTDSAEGYVARLRDAQPSRNAS
jgi:excisionase family DNA binding protein